MIGSRLINLFGTRKTQDWHRLRVSQINWFRHLCNPRNQPDVKIEYMYWVT